MLTYLVGIWRDTQLREPRPRFLPFVVPVVVHCGRRRWRAKTDLWSLFDTRGLPPDVAAGLQAVAPAFAIAPHDFAARTEGEIRSMALSLHGLWTIVCLQFLASAGRGEQAFARVLRNWADVGRKLMQAPTGQGALPAIQSYILKITTLTRPRLGAVIEEHLGTEAMKRFVSTYDRATLEGEAKGRAAGRAEALLRQLQHRFGPLPPRLGDRIAEATLDEIDRWTVRILDARSLDEVFAAS